VLSHRAGDRHADQQTNNVIDHKAPAMWVLYGRSYNHAEVIIMSTHVVPTKDMTRDEQHKR